MEVLGYSKGEICNRDGCEGILDEHEKDGCCSCHINPPCGYCTHDTTFCPECNYDAEEEQKESYDPNVDYSWYQELMSEQDKFRDDTMAMMRKEIPIDKFRCLIEGHTNSSMIKKGVYPENMEMEDVVREVRGTFGGRFKRFGDGVFEYVAYTD